LISSATMASSSTIKIRKSVIICLRLPREFYNPVCIPFP
jgi:hypothetical protein